MKKQSAVTPFNGVTADCFFCILLSGFLSEYREVYASVGAVLHKARVAGEVVVLTVFQHKHGVVVHQGRRCYPVGQFCKFGKRIWRVGEDQFERLGCFGYISERIAP